MSFSYFVERVTEHVVILKWKAFETVASLAQVWLVSLVKVFEV